MNSDLYPCLYQFFGAYFNEDWMCDFELADDVVRSFLVDSTKEMILAVQVEINRLLRQDLNEPVLRDFLLKDMSCCYCYWHDWSSGRAWLTHILAFFSEES